MPDVAFTETGGRASPTRATQNMDSDSNLPEYTIIPSGGGSGNDSGGGSGGGY